MLLALAEPVMLIATPHPAVAQQPRRVLNKAVTEFAEPFTSVSSVRELRDGRVIVADGRDRVVQIVDFVAQLQGLDTEAVEPLAHGIEVRNIFRDDVRGPALDREAALVNAPRRNGEAFLVPAVLE